MRKIFLLAILFLLASCERGSTDYIEKAYDETEIEHEYASASDSKESFGETGSISPFNIAEENISDEIPQNEESILSVTPIEFVTLPNGTRIDSRVSEYLASGIIRHFNAIETGDIDEFWDTLMGEDGVDFNHFVSLIYRYFENADYFHWTQRGFEIPDEHDWSEIVYQNRKNTGLFVREIGLINHTQNHNNEHVANANNTLIDIRGNWRNLEIISIPKNFSYDKGGLHNDVIANTNCPFVPSREVLGATYQIWAGYLKAESVEAVVESSLTAQEFLFDDGQSGYMLEFANDIWWVREDWMAMSFWHGGYRAVFEIHEDLILQIARTLRARDS